MKYYINANTEKLNSICFKGKSMKTVDLSHVDFENNDMSHSFQGCTQLTNVVNVSNNVTNMYEAFQGCTNLQSMVTIPNSVVNAGGVFAECYNLTDVTEFPDSVTNIQYAFANCYKLVNAPKLSANTTNMIGAFMDCYNLVNAPVIPSSLSSLYHCFFSCTNLVNAPTIPNSVTNMENTFFYCSKLKDAPTIPSSVTQVKSTFYACYNLVNAPEIPNAVTNMATTFGYCYNLTGDIIIHSSYVYNATDCFTSTSLTKNVFIPFKYDNGVYTRTYNTFTSAGYTKDGSVCGVYLKDINASDFCTVTINPTPSDATVVLTAEGCTQSGNSITVPNGTDVSYSVSKDGYNSVSKSLYIEDNKSINITLYTSGTKLGTYSASSNLANDNEVYSGFTNSDGITVSSSYNQINNEIISKFMITESRDTTNYLFNGSSLDVYCTYNCIYFYSNGSKRLLNAELNKWYWLKMVIVNSNSIKFFTSEDGETWNLIGTYTSYAVKAGIDIVLGKGASSAQSGFAGKVDMNEFKIYDEYGNILFGQV